MLFQQNWAPPPGKRVFAFASRVGYPNPQPQRTKSRGQRPGPLLQNKIAEAHECDYVVRVIAGPL